MQYVFDDGGRAAAGYRGNASDCVCSTIAIITGKSYQEVYDALNCLSARERPRNGRRSSARTGVRKPTIRRYLLSLGYIWTPTMHIGSGCTVHLRTGELPMGRLVVNLSRHLTALIDGVIHDTQDPARGGTRCVYGYWKEPSRIPG